MEEPLTCMDAVLVAPNPLAIIIRSRKECGLSGKGFLAAFGVRFESATKLPHPHSLIQEFVGVRDGLCDNTDESELLRMAEQKGRLALLDEIGVPHQHNVSPCLRGDWERFRDSVNKGAQGEHCPKRGLPARYAPDETWDGMLRRGMQLFLEHRDKFEATSFPMCFPHGSGTFASKRRTPLFLFDCARRMEQLSSSNPLLYFPYLVWANLMRMAAQNIASATPEEACTVDPRGLVLFLRHHFCLHCGVDSSDPPKPIKRCARCSVAGYCSRECQRKDWPLHKTRCQAQVLPGDLL
eukprot:TRINITY_DN20839_c0_g1_i1.p1 TRINITY_DN20839_c0_g1~~TRINITY_DN20839_c0_g1_i1.p1  ORF type:complete len:295 (-),score=62.46 TRINITY_DN20839_c0_g1_i1:112-996(-)